MGRLENQLEGHSHVSLTPEPYLLSSCVIRVGYVDVEFVASMNMH